MIPDVNNPNWARLVRGEIRHEFKNTSAGLLFFNLQHMYKTNPKTLPQQIEKARQFFQKYEAILTDDIKAIFK
ncbi:MAG: hypothetical protein QM784_27890 [Polyangiaceae bacterium]